MTVYIPSLQSLTSVITVITFIICLVQILRTLTCVINNFCHNGINAENGLCSRVHLDLGNAEMRNITGITALVVTCTVLIFFYFLAATANHLIYMPMNLNDGINNRRTRCQDTEMLMQYTATRKPLIITDLWLSSHSIL